MIVMDAPRTDTFRGRRITTAHLVSTLPAPEGTAELVAFAIGLGMRRAWIQHEGEPREHFDLMGGRCQAAIDAGAVVDKHTLVAAMRAKRGEQTYDRPCTHPARDGVHEVYLNEPRCRACGLPVPPGGP
jgi:hypothetical protein